MERSTTTKPRTSGITTFPTSGPWAPKASGPTWLQVRALSGSTYCFGRGCDTPTRRVLRHQPHKTESLRRSTLDDVSTPSLPAGPVPGPAVPESARRSRIILQEHSIEQWRETRPLRARLEAVSSICRWVMGGIDAHSRVLASPLHASEDQQDRDPPSCQIGAVVPSLPLKSWAFPVREPRVAVSLRGSMITQAKAVTNHQRWDEESGTRQASY